MSKKVTIWLKLNNSWKPRLTFSLQKWITINRLKTRCQLNFANILPYAYAWKQNKDTSFVYITKISDLYLVSDPTNNI